MLSTVQGQLEQHVKKDHTKLTSNPIWNHQLRGQTNVGTLSDFITVCLFSKGPVRVQLEQIWVQYV